MQQVSEDTRSPFSPFMQRLSSRPVLVTVVSFALTLVLTVAVLLLEPDTVDILGIVSLAATLWGLTLALVIYLLTAQDTDRVLEHINDLQEQLSASLAEPDSDEAAEVSEDADPEPGSQSEALKETQEVQNTKQQGALAQRRRGGGPGGQRDRGFFYTQESGVKLEETAPASYLEAWVKTTGLDVSQVFRAWSRSQEGSAPWVFMTRDGRRWSVFAAEDGTPSVIDLTDVRWNRAGNRGGRGRHPGQIGQGRAVRQN